MVAWVLLVLGPCLSAAGAEKQKLPSPPQGYRWQLIPGLSDEFTGSSLDKGKWLARHPYWSGRDSRHEPDNVSVANGMLRLKSSLREDAKSVNKSTVTAACVASKQRHCHPYRKTD